MDHSFRLGFRYHIDDVRRQHQQRSYLMRSGILVDDAQLRPLKSDNYAESKAMALFVSDEINFNSLKVTVGLRHEEISGEFDNKLSGVITSNKQSITAPGLGFTMKSLKTWVFWRVFTEGFLLLVREKKVPKLRRVQILSMGLDTTLII